MTGYYWQYLVKAGLPKDIRRKLRLAIHRKVWLAERFLSLLKAHLYDLKCYVRHSSVMQYDDSEEKLRAITTIAYHRVEKGLSLPEPRIGFGKNLVGLTRNIDECHSRFGPRDYLAVPISAMGAYLAFHEKHGHDVAVVRGSYERLIRANAEMGSSVEPGGVRTVRGKEITEMIKFGGLPFFESRFSCRQFTDAPVTTEQIEVAVRVAQKSPSVCNRQAGRIYAFTEPSDIRRLLELQAGARGFLHVVKALFCVVSDIRNFHPVGERYQGWIDGGMFAMSFVYGLHMQGIGTCCLNWSKEPSEDEAMHRAASIPEYERIIMFIAAGHLPEEFVVAKSVRKRIDEVLIYKGDTRRTSCAIR